jgi:Zn-dependent protease
MSEIEDEIRRQLIAERELAAQQADNTALPIPAAVPNQPPSPSVPAAPPTAKRKGLLGSLGAVGVVLGKFWGVTLSLLLKLKSLLILLKLGSFAKLLIAGGSMIFSMCLMSGRLGWKFGVGLVLLIAIHECGHALAAYRLGRKLGIMVFIPFCGAFVTSRGGRDVKESAFIGIMGPVAGTLATFACLLMFLATGQRFWLVLAWFGCFINLINLAPSPPLDGGWLLPLFSPKLLLPAVLIGLLIFYRNPLFWVFALMSVPRMMYAWKHGNTSAYFAVTARDRWIYGLAWAGLAIVLGAGMLMIPAILRAMRLLA